MQIKVIRASYRNLEEFKGSNENDKNKLMWDAENLSNIPLFAKDVKALGIHVPPLDVVEFMAENQPVLIQGVGPLRQHRAHGFVEQANGQGG